MKSESRPLCALLDKSKVNIIQSVRRIMLMSLRKTKIGKIMMNSLCLVLKSDFDVNAEINQNYFLLSGKTEAKN